VDEYEEECVPSGGFAYEKVSKNLYLIMHISADTIFFHRLYAKESVSTREYMNEWVNLLLIFYTQGPTVLITMRFNMRCEF